MVKRAFPEIRFDNKIDRTVAENYGFHVMIYHWQVKMYRSYNHG